MDRCKLEYMIKRFEFKEKKRVIQEIDPYGDYEFKKDISSFLLDPNTTDFYILNNLPILKYFPEEKEPFLNKYIDLYKEINELCIKNNTYPFFKDPTNVSECEKIRLDIVKIIPENFINEYFGVGSLGEYDPPRYNDDNSDC